MLALMTVESEMYSKIFFPVPRIDITSGSCFTWHVCSICFPNITVLLC